MRSRLVKIFIKSALVLLIIFIALVLFTAWRTSQYLNYINSIEVGVSTPADLKPFINLEASACIILGHAKVSPPNLVCRRYLTFLEKDGKMLISHGTKNGYIGYYRVISVESVKSFSKIEGSRHFVEAVNNCNSHPECNKKRIQNRMPDFNKIAPEAIKKITSVRWHKVSGTVAENAQIATMLGERTDYLISSPDGKTYAIWYDYSLVSPDSDFSGFYIFRERPLG